MVDYITPDGLERLKSKLSTLLEERKQYREKIIASHEAGNTAELTHRNDALEQQDIHEREISYLERCIATLIVIDPSTLPKHDVRFGAYVKILNKNTQTIYHYHLVGPDEIYDRDDDIVHVSYASPLGKAMMGKYLDQEFVVRAPIGDITYQILEIK